MNKLYPVLSLGAAAFLSVSSSAQQPQKQPNIVYIMSDDHAFQAISAYGGPP